VNLNKYWSHFDVDEPILQEQRIIFDPENLIQLHLSLVEKHLEQKDVSHLNQSQIKKRTKGLQILKKYWEEKTFPKNTRHSGQIIPYFIDDFNTACAVGHILRETGGNQLAQQIQLENNYAYIEDMDYPELLAWAKEYGFEEKELRWIQPQYGSICSDGYFEDFEFYTPNQGIAN